MSGLFQRLSAALAEDCAPILPGDDVELAPGEQLQSAAVLIAITDTVSPAMLLTVRREHMRTHAGQVAFPGGRLDPDENAIGAALREAEEEIGLDPSVVRVAGQLSDYRTITGYLVTPVVGVIPPGLDLAPHEAEVAALFEVPLATALDPARHLRRSALFRGRERHYYEVEWQDHRIWGATAAMIVNLAARLQWA